VHFHSNPQGEVVLETSNFLVPLPEPFRFLSPFQSFEPFLRQNRNASKELATRGIYAVGIVTHDERTLQFDCFLGYHMGLQRLPLYVQCGFASLYVSLPVSYVFVYMQQRYRGLPTFTATVTKKMAISRSSKQ
jgi:hypothetical protein